MALQGHIKGNETYIFMVMTDGAVGACIYLPSGMERTRPREADYTLSAIHYTKAAPLGGPVREVGHQGLLGGV